MFKNWFAAGSYWRQSCAIKHLHKREQASVAFVKKKNNPFPPFVNSKVFFFFFFKFKELNAAYSWRNARNNSSWTFFQSTKIWVRVYIVNQMMLAQTGWKHDTCSSSKWLYTTASQDKYALSMYTLLNTEAGHPKFSCSGCKKKKKKAKQISTTCTTDFHVIKFRAP